MDRFPSLVSSEDGEVLEWSKTPTKPWVCWTTEGYKRQRKDFAEHLAKELMKDPVMQALVGKFRAS